MFDALNIPSTPVITCKRCGEDKCQHEFIDHHKNRFCIRTKCRPCQNFEKKLYKLRVYKRSLAKRKLITSSPARSKLTGGV